MKSFKTGFDDIITLHAKISNSTDINISGTEFILDGCKDEDIEATKSQFLSFSNSDILKKTQYREVINKVSDITNIFSAVSAWVRKSKTFGKEGLLNKEYNTSYSAQVKTQAVIDYLDCRGSLNDICIKYKISAITIRQQWIKNYNGHKIFKSHSTKGDKLMTNGRKITYEERIEIISFSIYNAHNYNLAANKFNVSYQQVYTWVKKYNKNGHNTLVDRRGKKKSFEELTKS